MARSGLLLVVVLAVGFVHGGIVTNQSGGGTESVSTSVSSSGSASPSSVPAKPARAGKVLYTAPYSNVRVTTKQEGKLLEGRLRSFGPVLVKAKKSDGEQIEVSSSTTTTSTTTTSTTTSPTSTSTTSAPLEIDEGVSDATTIVSEV